MKFYNSVFFILLFLFYSIISCSSKNDSILENKIILDKLECLLKESLKVEKVERMIPFASVCNEMGFYVEARDAYIEVLDEYERIPNKDSQYIKVLLDVGFVSIKLGDYKEAEKYLLKAKEFCCLEENTFRKNHEITIYFYLGHLYYALGNYLEAEKNYLSSQKIALQIYGDSNFNDITYLTSIGRVYSSLNKESEVDEYLHKALDIYRRDGLSFNDSLSLLMYIGDTYAKQKKYEKAESIYLQTLSMAKGNINRETQMIILNNLGYLYYKQNDYIKAEKYYKELLFSCFYNFHGNKADFLVNIADVYFKLSKWEEAEDCYNKASTLAKQQYYNSLDHLIESEREFYWEKLNMSFEVRYPLFVYKYYFTNPQISTFAYNNELFSKGLLLTSLTDVRNSILKSGDSTLIKNWDDLVFVKKVVMHLEENEPQSKALETYRNRAYSLEKIVTKSSIVFRERKERQFITWKDVKKRLSRKEAAIEFFSVPLSQDSTMYCALLLHHNSKYPELIPLFEEKEVSSYLNTIKKRFDNNNLYSYKNDGEKLTNLIWSKIQDLLKEGETIYFSPSGLLHQLAIEYLPVDSARTMSDAYNMVRLSSTREIVTNKSKESYKSAVVYGGIHYELDNKTILTESNHYPELKRSSLENDSINRGSAKFLPGTKDEAEKINKLLIDNKIKAKIFKTKSANEESFKSLSGKHNNILHIATHGFTWTDSTARKQDYFADRMQMQLVGDNQMRGPIIDPLDRCGLLFAGANTALQGKSKELPEGVQDGILTAKEISLMDLRDAELVVLSACETAKGDITSEGVFGLQRAFKMAGAKTIIMSLWKVDDRATQLLMTEFYTNWISKKQPKREAFRNAQNTVKKQYPKPSYWAGFVMLD